MSKALNTIRARCALLGIVLATTEDDRGRSLFVVSRWAMTRAFSSLAEVESWLVGIEGRRP